MKVSKEEVDMVYFLLTLGLMTNMISNNQARVVIEKLEKGVRPEDLKKFVSGEIDKLKER